MEDMKTKPELQYIYICEAYPFLVLAYYILTCLNTYETSSYTCSEDLNDHYIEKFVGHIYSEKDTMCRAKQEWQ